MLILPLLLVESYLSLPSTGSWYECVRVWMCGAASCRQGRREGASRAVRPDILSAALSPFWPSGVLEHLLLKPRGRAGVGQCEGEPPSVSCEDRAGSAAGPRAKAALELKPKTNKELLFCC